MGRQPGVAKLLEKHWLIPKDQQDVKCPYCGRVWMDSHPFITLHGEEPPGDIDCPDCGKTFLVEERVERWFHITKKGEQDD